MGLWKNKEDNETVETEEYDFEDMYQAIFKINKK